MINTKRIESGKQPADQIPCFDTLFSILSNIKRFRIFYSLTLIKQLSFKDLKKVLNINDSLVTYHLQKLELSNVLSKNKNKNIFYYSLNLKNKNVIKLKKFLS